MGVPAISTNVSAIPEILKDGETGLVVEPENPEQMAEAIMQILTDQQLRTKLINNGKTYVRTNFDNRRWITQFAEIFPRHNDHFPQLQQVEDQQS